MNKREMYKMLKNQISTIDCASAGHKELAKVQKLVGLFSSTISVEKSTQMIRRVNELGGLLEIYWGCYDDMLIHKATVQDIWKNLGGGSLFEHWCDDIPYPGYFGQAPIYHPASFWR